MAKRSDGVMVAVAVGAVAVVAWLAWPLSPSPGPSPAQLKANQHELLRLNSEGITQARQLHADCLARLTGLEHTVCLDEARVDLRQFELLRKEILANG